MKTQIPHEVKKLIPSGYIQVLPSVTYFDPTTGEWSSIPSPYDLRRQSNYTWGAGKPAVLIYQYDGVYTAKPYTDPSGSTVSSTYELNATLDGGVWMFGDASGPFYLFAQP